MLGVSSLSLLDSSVWLGALCAESTFHLALISLGIAAGFLLRGHRRESIPLVALAAVLLMPTRGFFVGQRLTPPQGALLDVAQMHLAGQPLAPERLARWLSKERPDLVSITGLASTDATRLSPAFSGLWSRAREGAPEGGVVLLFRPGLRTSHPTRQAPPQSVRLRLGRCALSVRQVALPSIHRRDGWLTRDDSLRELLALPERERAIWLGHFGSDARASDLSAVRSNHGLRDVRIGHGRLASAPASFHALGFPVSHVLVHGWIAARKAYTEPPLVDGGHRIVRARLELTEPHCSQKTRGAHARAPSEMP